MVGRGRRAGDQGAVVVPTNDYGVIQVTSSSAVSTPYVDRYSAGSDVRVSGARTAVVGQAADRVDNRVAVRLVTATNQTGCYAQACV